MQILNPMYTLESSLNPNPALVNVHVLTILSSGTSMCHYNPHYTLLYSNYSLIYIYISVFAINYEQCSVSFLLLVINLSDLDNLLKVNLSPNF